MKFHHIGILFLLLASLSACGTGLWSGRDKKLDMPGERLSVTTRSKDLIKIEPGTLNTLNLAPLHQNEAWNGHYNHIPAGQANLQWNEGPQRLSLSYSSSTSLIQPTLPVIDNGIIYVMSVDGVLSAYTAEGSIIWQNNFFYTEENISFFNFTFDKFLGGGLVKHQDVIYVSGGLAKLVALDAKTGENIWIASLSSPIRSVPLVSGDLVVVQSIDNKIYALNHNTGSIVWTYMANSEEATALATSALSQVGDIIIAKLNNDELIALDRDTGEEIWEHNLTDKQSFDSMLRTSYNLNNMFFVGSGYIITNNTKGVLFKIDVHTGNTIWSKDVSATARGWLSGNAYFFVSMHNELVCLDVDKGKVAWLLDLNLKDADNKVVSDLYISNPVVAKNNVYIANNKGALIEVDAISGMRKNEYSINQQVYFAPVFAGGFMYVLSNDGELQIF